MVSWMKICLQLITIVGVLVAFTTARPQTSAASQDRDNDVASVGIPELRKFYSALNSYAASNSDENPFERLHIAPVASQYNGFSGDVSGGGAPWPQIYHSPEMKRQVRYRQCYFNPISCFKK